ncbi:MAG: alpha/beta hydrolase [Gammaproteobacteria bacterium]|nr:alpha/beta hydrolase [Gammaproteobacteria bacterium]
MKSERVSFLNTRGVRLAARLDLPSRHTPKAWVLFAHCFTCSKEFKAAVNIGKTLARAGFGVLRFDFTGLGESEGEFSDTNLTSNIDDVISAVRFLEAHYAAPQILIGHSFCGIAMLKAARSVPSSVAVVTIATPSDPKHVLEHFGENRTRIESEGDAEVQVLGHRVRIKRQFIDDVMAAEVQADLRDLGKALLILHAPGDEVIGIDHAAQLFAHARHPKSFITLDSADHLLSDRYDAAYAGAVIATWVSRYLTPATHQEVASGSDDAKSLAPSIESTALSAHFL